MSDGFLPSMRTAAAGAVPALQIASTRLPSKSSASLPSFQATSLPTTKVLTRSFHSAGSAFGSGRRYALTISAMRKQPWSLRWTPSLSSA